MIILTYITAGKVLEAALRKAQSELQARFTRQTEDFKRTTTKPKARTRPSPTKRAKPRTRALR